MRANDRSEDLTWRAFKNGSREAFATIFREHARSLLSYGYKITSDRRIIEDSIQDLFFELWKNRAGLSDTTSVRFYLLKALRYKILRNMKISGRDTLYHLEEGIASLVDPPHEHYLIGLEVQSFQMAHLKELIRKLPGRQQEAINLRYYHNLSNEQIAGVMGVNYQSACKFLYSALKTLKANLKVSITSFLFFVLFF
jgi:RNA polymerase sigma factor (sigma-70 family)